MIMTQSLLNLPFSHQAQLQCNPVILSRQLLTHLFITLQTPVATTANLSAITGMGKYVPLKLGINGLATIFTLQVKTLAQTRTLIQDQMIVSAVGIVKVAVAVTSLEAEQVIAVTSIVVVIVRLVARGTADLKQIVEVAISLVALNAFAVKSLQMNAIVIVIVLVIIQVVVIILQ